MSKEPKVSMPESSGSDDEAIQVITTTKKESEVIEIEELEEELFDNKVIRKYISTFFLYFPLTHWQLKDTTAKNKDAPDIVVQHEIDTDETASEGKVIHILHFSIIFS